MKIFKIMAVALVAMLGFTACENDPEHIYDDHSADLVGTWTCLNADLAETLVIKADGSVLSTGSIFGEEYWEDVKGNIVLENGNVTMTFEDGDIYKGHLDIIPGKAFSIYNASGRRFTYDYCANDLADEIIGMWVCNDGPSSAKNDMMIQTFNEDGSTVMTGHADEILVNDKSTSYKVVGDLVFLTMNKESVKYESFRMTYSPNGTDFGDVMTLTLNVNNANIAPATTWLRVKQNLNLNGKTYDYSSAYVSNAKGTDEDFTIFGNTFNMAKIEAGNFDVFFRSELFCVDLNANSIKQYYRTANGQDIVVEIPITVDGNKVTLDLSAENPAFRKVDMYMYQDADDSQLHMYMHTDAFINYFANLQIFDLISDGKIDPTDATAVDKVYTDMDARVESINVSFVMKARK